MSADLTDSSITELTSPADGDLLYAVDVSDTTTAPASADGSSKKLTLGTLATFIGSGQQAYVNVKASPYGAAGDGTTDDTTAVQAAITAALAAPGGTAAVYFPSGVYKISDTLNCLGSNFTSVPLIGDDRSASTIQKAFSGPLVTFDGSGGPNGSPTGWGGLRNITLDGNNNTGPLLQTNSAQQMMFFNASFINNPDLTLDLNSIEDSYFIGCTSNNCGSDTHRVIEIQGSDTSGTSNMLYFIGLRVETFLLGAVGISNGDCSGIYFSNYKFETVTARGDIVSIASAVQQVSFRDGFIAADAFASGFSTRVNAITYGDATASDGGNKLTVDNLSVYGSSTIASCVKVDGTNMAGAVRLDDIDCYDTPSAGLLSLTGMSASLAMHGNALPAVRTLTDAATIAIDASYGKEFRLASISANRTLGLPANAQDGKKIVVVINPSTHTLSYATGYNWGASGAPTLTASKDNYLGFAYDAAASQWRGIAFSGGF